MRLNLTIDTDDKIIQIDYLKDAGDTVTGTDYIFGLNVARLRDELDGWWFDRIHQTEFDRKLMFADIVNLDGSPIGDTTQAEVTALLLAALHTPAAE